MSEPTIINLNDYDETRYIEPPEQFIRPAGHFDGCWRNHGECAISYAAQLENELTRVRQLIRDYYTVESFPTDAFIRETLGDDEARKLGIVIDVVEETRVALENGWIEEHHAAVETTLSEQ
jgi:predicted transglutaminase-like cysteine proteinase